MPRAIWPFGAQSIQQQRNSVQPAAALVISSADAKKFGLENFGNTCYANSVIQALYFCTPFRDLLLQVPDPSADLQHPPLPDPPPELAPIRRKPERKQSTDVAPTTSVPAAPPIPTNPPTLFSALRSLFYHISTNPAEKGSVAPRAFIEKLKQLNEDFRGDQHQDAHEFLNYLLNKIIEEIEEIRKNNNQLEDLSSSVVTVSSKPATTVVTTSTSNSGTSSQDATLVHKLFEGVLTSETRCLTCETVSSRDESFFDLSLDIEQNSSVTACLRQFSASEMLCQKNKFFCDSCCDLQEAEKRMKIKKLPNVLALHLKRFKFQENLHKLTKLSYRVAFPFSLRLFNTVDEAPDADRMYNLFGIVVHIGHGPHHGHYISIIKTQGTWLVFDDENVHPITESDIAVKYFGDANASPTGGVGGGTTTGSAGTAQAYVLYYQAVDIDLAALGLTTQAAATSSTSTSKATASGTVNLPPPPGLTEEADSSDLSDPSFPITPPSQGSPLLSVKTSKSALEAQQTSPDPNEISPATVVAHTPGATPTPNTPTAVTNNHASSSGSSTWTKAANGLLSSMRRAPSTQPSVASSSSSKLGTAGTTLASGLGGRRSVSGPGGITPVGTEDQDEETAHAHSPGVPPSPAVSQRLSRGSGIFATNGKEHEQDASASTPIEKDAGKKKEPERKSSGWFGKRKSFRLGDSKRGATASESDMPPSPSVGAPHGGFGAVPIQASSSTRSGGSVHDDSGHGGGSSSTPWFKTAGFSANKSDKEKEKKTVRETNMFSGGGGGRTRMRVKSSVGKESKPPSGPRASQTKSQTYESIPISKTSSSNDCGYDIPPPSSAHSSVGSSSSANLLPQPQIPLSSSPASISLEFPPPRTSSLPVHGGKTHSRGGSLSSTFSVARSERSIPPASGPPPSGPLPLPPIASGSPTKATFGHKKSMSSLPMTAKERKHSLDVRPNTANGSGGDADAISVRPLPPLPAASAPPISPPNGHIHALTSPPPPTPPPKGDILPDPMDGGPQEPPGGHSILPGPVSAANSSATNTTASVSSSNTSGHLHKPKRKLSIPAPKFGLAFGRKDKDRKERETDDDGKSPPTSFGVRTT